MQQFIFYSTGVDFKLHYNVTRCANLKKTKYRLWCFWFCSCRETDHLQNRVKWLTRRCGRMVIETSFNRSHIWRFVTIVCCWSKQFSGHYPSPRQNKTNKTRRLGDWSLSPSLGKTYFVWPNRYRPQKSKKSMKITAKSNIVRLRPRGKG